MNTDITWVCPDCGTANEDDYAITIFPTCEGCFKTCEWETIMSQQQARIAELERKLEASTILNVSAANAAYRDVDTIDKLQHRLNGLSAAARDVLAEYEKVDKGKAGDLWGLCTSLMCLNVWLEGEK